MPTAAADAIIVFNQTNDRATKRYDLGEDLRAKTGVRPGPASPAVSFSALALAKCDKFSRQNAGTAIGQDVLKCHCDLQSIGLLQMEKTR